MNTALERYERVLQNDHIQKIIEVEPDFKHILDQATVTGGMEMKWKRYDMLKHEGEKLVGWKCSNPVLSSHVYHEALTWALDQLLPDESAFDANRERRRQLEEEYEDA